MALLPFILLAGDPLQDAAAAFTSCMTQQAHRYSATMEAADVAADAALTACNDQQAAMYKFIYDLGHKVGKMWLNSATDSVDRLVEAQKRLAVKTIIDDRMGSTQKQ